ncbi:MAG TPA: chemotaxis protein CheX [Terriglobales bacterium]|nr:chemotaxis protein CheX [Terriglobales bacterium]
MSTDTSLLTRSHQENWLPVLELAIEEVFEIMVGQRVKPAPKTESPQPGGFTAMVGIAGALCGILTISCSKKTAREVAVCMLGPEIGDSEEQVSDALGEVCNMIAGNFKNKLSSASQSCMLSVPTVIKGEEYSYRSLADGEVLDTVMLFSDAPLLVCLQLHS